MDKMAFCLSFLEAFNFSTLETGKRLKRSKANPLMG